jgi:hypothetical protein
MQALKDARPAVPGMVHTGWFADPGTEKNRANPLHVICLCENVLMYARISGMHRRALKPDASIRCRKSPKSRQAYEKLMGAQGRRRGESSWHRSLT